MHKAPKHSERPLLQFPGDFSIKAIGAAGKTFELAVLSIIKKHVSNIKENAINTRLSNNQRYLSITISITAESKMQLDAIYQDLTDCEHVLVAL